GVDEAVQEGLDRGPGAAEVDQTVGEIVDHLLVAHVLTIEQAQDVVHAHAGEVLALDRLEIGPAALHAQHRDLAAAVIALDGLDRSVAAAPHDQRSLGADQARGVDEAIELREFAGFGVIPPRSHRGGVITWPALTRLWTGRGACSAPRSAPRPSSG